MPGIDATYRAFLPTLPDAIRRAALELPHRLGLTSNPEGGWNGLVLLDLNREPTAYAAEDPGGPGRFVVSERALALYREAHHWAGIHWVTTDAIADGAPPSPHIARLRRTFVRNWAGALTLATGDRALSRARVGDALGAVREAIEDERRLFASGSFSPAGYAAVVKRKVQCHTTTAGTLLDAAGLAERSRLFGELYEAFLFALQCRDDAEDAREDQARGASVPRALGVSPLALWCAATRVVAPRVPRAEAAGFRRLAAFYARWLDVSKTPARLAPQDERDAAAIAEAYEAAVVSRSSRAR